MDSKDRPEPNVPAVPLRSAPRPALLDTSPYGRSAAAEPARSVNVLRAVFRAVTRNWWQILLLWGLGTGGLCYLVLTRVHPIYSAESLLRVEPSQRDLFGTGMHSSESFATFLETQVHLILSPNVLTTVATDPAVSVQPSLHKTTDVEAELRRLLTVTVVPNTYFLRVGMSSESPQECATIVNAVVRSYLRSATEWAEGMTRNQTKSLENYQRQLRDSAKEKEDLWLELAAKGNVEVDLNEDRDGRDRQGLPPPATKKVTKDQYKKACDELFLTNIQLAEAEALLTMRESEAPAQAAGDEDGARLERRVGQMFRSDPQVIDLLRRIEQARRTYSEARRLARSSSDPSVVAALKKLGDLDDQYRRLYREMRPDLVARLEEQGGDGPGQGLRELREVVTSLRAKKASYEKTLKEIEVAHREEASDAVKVAWIQQEWRTVKNLEESVKKRLEQLDFESRGEARISQVNAAKANFLPVTDNRKKYLTAAPVGVLLFVLGLFVMLEVKIGRVSDLDDLSKQMPVEVFALPPLPGPRLEPGRRGARERESRLQEFLQSLDHLRVALCDEPGAATGSGRCLLVTSATASEGKTTLSAQLAACCAKAGIATLLVDGDMRRATLSRMLSEDKTPGLSDVLQGDLAPEDAAVAIPDAGFHLLPAGTPGRDPSWLLKGQRIGQTLARYRQLFDLIIIDTPPVLPVPDALTVGRWTDGVVLTTRFDVSRFPLVEKARRRMSAAGIPLLKTVVNGVKTSGYVGFYGYGYGYGGYADAERAASPSGPESTATA